MILGSLKTLNDKLATFAGDAPENVRYADGYSAEVTNMIDDYITRNEITATDADPDEADMPDTGTTCISGLEELDLPGSGSLSRVY